MTFDAGLGRKIRHPLVCRDVFRAAIRIAAVVKRVDADIDVVRAKHFGVGQTERKKDRVARRYVSDRNLMRDLAERTILGHRNVGGKRRTAEHPQIDVDNHMARRAQPCGNAAGRLDLDLMALAVTEGERARFEAVAPRNRERRGRIDSAAKQDDGSRQFGHCSRLLWRFSPAWF